MFSYLILCSVFQQVSGAKIDTGLVGSGISLKMFKKNFFKKIEKPKMFFQAFMYFVKRSRDRLFRRDIPLSLLISVAVVVFSFVGASGALTLIVPWQNISIETPFPSAYAERDWYWAKYVVSIGALAAMLTCLLSVLYVIPRYLLAMSRDGLLWTFLTKLTSSTQVL